MPDTFSTQHSKEVPEQGEAPENLPPANAPIEELLAELYRVCDEVAHVPAWAYLEALIVIGDLLERRDDHHIPVEQIYAELSDEAEAAIRGRGGVTKLSDSDKTLDTYDNYRRDKDGEVLWRGTPSYYLQPLAQRVVHNARQELRQHSNYEVAKATAELVEHGVVSELFSTSDHDTSQGTAQAQPGQAEAGGMGEGGQEDQGEDKGARHGTNGFVENPPDHPENRQSERSDVESEVDIWSVNPPVTEKCNREQWGRLTRVTKSLSEQWLVLQLINSSRAATYNSGEDDDGRWVVMHHEKLHDEYGVSYPTRTIWKDSEIIEAKQDGRFVSPQEAEETEQRPAARELRVKQSFLDEWTRLGAEGGSYRYKAHRRELVRTREPQPLQTRLCDKHGNDIPPLVKEALKVLRDVEQKGCLDAIEEAEQEIARREGAKARDQLTSLRLAKETVKRQVIQSQEGVVQLQNAYEIQRISGRVSFKRGGPQGLMGEVKARFYDLDDHYNWDIKSCHTSGFKQVAKMLAEIGVEIDVSPWEQYPGKYQVAARTSLPVGLIKVVEHAVKYGAVLPDSMEQVRKFYVDDNEDEDDRSNWPSLAKEVNEYEEQGLLHDADEALQTLNDVFGEMREVVIEMAEALLTDYYDAHHSGGWMENACGVSFGKHTYDEGHEQRSKVMAWMLQGLEAAFCHHLTILSAESDVFTVVANEHDGLIIRREIDDEDAFLDAIADACDTARERSGFHQAEFVQKPFADEEDVAEIYGEDEDEETAEESDSDVSTTSAPPTSSGDSIPSEPEPPELNDDTQSSSQKEEPAPDETRPTRPSPMEALG